MVERRFASLKKWLVLQGGIVESIITAEMECDAAMALDNLMLRMLENLQNDIPARALFAPDAHIITRSVPPPLKIPKAVDWKAAAFPAHLKAFREALTVVVPRVSKAIQVNGPQALFSNRIVKRAENLRAGGNVLQVSVQDAGGGSWWVRMTVGASMKDHVYNCWVHLTVGAGITATMGSCKNGYGAREACGGGCGIGHAHALMRARAATTIALMCVPVCWR
jgi:hypothetical protein